MRFREVTVVAAVANEPTIRKGNDHLEFTNSALTMFASNPPATCPVMDSHGTTEAQRIGHVARWELVGDTLTAVLRITDLSHRVPEVGDGVSLGINYTSRMSEKTGYKRITSFEVRELTLVGGGERGALKSARVVAVGEVQGAHDDAPTGQLATAMKAAGMTPGFTKVTGSIDSVK